MALTFRWAIETDVELLHIVIDKIYFIIGHQPGKQTMSRSAEREEKEYIFMTSVSMRRFPA